MRTLELPAPPTAPTAVARIALPHAHGHARVQRAQPCSAARGRQPAGTAPGNGWRWRPEPLPSRRCAAGTATIKLSDNLSPRLCRRPLHGVARGCAGLGAAVPAAPPSVTIGTSAQSTTILIAVALLLLEVLRSMFTVHEE